MAGHRIRWITSRRLVGLVTHTRVGAQQTSGRIVSLYGAHTRLGIRDPLGAEISWGRTRNRPCPPTSTQTEKTLGRHARAVAREAGVSKVWSLGAVNGPWCQAGKISPNHVIQIERTGTRTHGGTPAGDAVTYAVT